MDILVSYLITSSILTIILYNTNFMKERMIKYSYGRYMYTWLVSFLLSPILGIFALCSAAVQLVRALK